ncbi:MAG: hypothetical protein ACYC54_08870 [Sedimentisphaerales bacterium]
MPLKMQTKPEVPNTIFFPQILIQTGINNGDLRTSCQLVLSAAKVDAQGKWTPTGQTQTVYIPDIAKLEEDLVHLAPTVQQLYGIIVGLVDGINAVRKIL